MTAFYSRSLTFSFSGIAYRHAYAAKTPDPEHRARSSSRSGGGHDRHLHLPDIVCLQEVFEKDCARLAAVGDYQVKYAISTLMPEGSKGHTSPRSWGVAVLTPVPVHRQTLSYYADDPRIRIFKERNDPHRLVVMTEIEHEGRFYRIGTTHLHLVHERRSHRRPARRFRPAQTSAAAIPALCSVRRLQRAARQGNIRESSPTNWASLDHLPADVTSTLDPKLHRAGTLELAVDTIFSTPEYRVTGVQVFEGLSDHKGILARIERRRISRPLVSAFHLIS